MFGSSNAFDNSTLFYEQLKFTWLVRIGIAVEFGGEVNAPGWTPVQLYDTFNLVTRAFRVCQACNQCQRISHRPLLLHREVERRYFDRDLITIKSKRGYPHHAYGGILGLCKMSAPCPTHFCETE